MKKSKYITNNALNNPYMGFQHGTANEQLLEEQLIDEMIYNFGHTVLYMPRTYVNEDLIFGEDNESIFTDALPLPLLWTNSADYDGPQYNIAQTFGMQYDISFNFVLGETDWNRYIVSLGKDSNKGKKLGINAPSPGDLLVFNPYPATDGNKKSPFYLEVKSINTQSINAMNIQYGWTLICKTLDYTHNDIITGIEQADGLEQFFSNSTEIRDGEIGTDNTHFGNNNEFLTQGLDLVIDNGKFNSQNKKDINNVKK